MSPLAASSLTRRVVRLPDKYTWFESSVRRSRRPGASDRLIRVVYSVSEMSAPRWRSSSSRRGAMRKNLARSRHAASYWVTDSVYQAMFLTTRHGVVLVDAPPTIGHNLLRAIGAVTRASGRPANVTHPVYSHSHADHIGASSLLGADVVRIGHSECRRLLLRDDDSYWPAPAVTFDDHYVLEAGGEQLLVDYNGPNHTPDNIFIYAPESACLMV